MFIWTARVNVKKIVLTAAVAVAVCASAAAVLLGARQAQAAAAVSPKGIKTADDRVAYLQEWGWQVSPEAVLTEELVLPEQFGEEYTKYLELQKEMGFDLTDHAGKRVKRYTYEVLNYPGGETGVTAHLLLRRNTVIGGEIVGRDFLHSLAMPG